eukprot:jgi/Mesvir1/28278/Mv04802-RA.1
MVSLDDVVSVAGLGAQLMEHLPLGQRVKTRCVSRSLMAAVDESLVSVERIYCDDIMEFPEPGNTEPLLMWLAEKCPNLQILSSEPRECSHLPTSLAADISDAALVAVATHCPRLTSLSVPGSLVTDAGLQALGIHCRHLRHLSLEMCMSVTDAGLSSVARHCPSLDHVNVWDCRGVTDTSVIVLALHCPGLQHLSLGGTGRAITDASIGIVGASCPHLRQLDLWGCEAVSDASVRVLASRCHHLEGLVLGHTMVTDASIRTVARKCPRLRLLDVSSCGSRVTDVGIKALAEGCPDLEHLNVSLCCFVTDAGLTTVADRGRLIHLFAQGCLGVTNRTVAALADACHGLECLELAGCFGVTDVGMRLLAAHCPRMRHLGMRGCSRPPVDMNRLRSMFGAACTIVV